MSAAPPPQVEPPRPDPAPSVPPVPEAAAPESLSIASERTFNARTVIWLAVVATLSLAATLVVPVLEEDTPTRSSAENDAYSRSAVGHHALVAFLRKSGVSVTVSRYRTASKAGPDRALLINEPDEYEADELKDLIVDGLQRGGPVIVVLPKWDEDVDYVSDRWIRDASLHGADVPGRVLSEAYIAGQTYLYDYEWAGSAADDVAAAIVRPGVRVESTWVNYVETSAAPTLPAPQLVAMDGSGLDGVFWDETEGTSDVLIGAWPDMALYVVSDPDLVNTMGLSRGDNGLIFYRFLVDYLDVDSLVVDEIVHGYEKPESIWAELLSFPLIIVTLHLLGLLILVLWAALSRFGKPADRPPRVPPGKQTLVHNTATLLALGGHVGHGVRAYFRAALRDVARAYALPPEQSDARRLTTLSRLAEQRGVDTDLHQLAIQVAAIRDQKRESRRAVGLARRIYRFRQEMIDGHRSHQAAR